jgi:hypothetical protein
MLIELRPVVALQHRDDPVGRERLLVGPLGPHGVVHVRDPAEHRAEVEGLPLRQKGIARPVHAEVMFEGHDRREDWHLRRPAEDLGAVHRVPPHNREFVVGELVGLVEDLLGRADLADVVHQRRQPELAQQTALDPERAGLTHRQDGHVHHMGERVVVVVAHGREGHQCGPILSHRLGQSFDGIEGRREIRLPFRLGALPCGPGGDDRIGVELPDGRHVAADPVIAPLLRREPPDAYVGKRPGGRRRVPASQPRDGQHEAPRFVGDQTPLEDDPLDPVILQPLDEFAHPGARLRQRRIGDHEVAADDADSDRAELLVQCLERGQEALDVPRDERVVGRVQLRRADAGREPPKQFLGLGDAIVDVG